MMVTSSRCLLTTLTLLTLVIRVRMQFFDYFQGFQPLIQNRPVTTRVVTQRHRQYDYIYTPDANGGVNQNNYRNNNNYYNNNQRFSSENIDNSYDVATRKTTLVYNNEDRQTRKPTRTNTSTTSKPFRRINSSQSNAATTKPKGSRRNMNGNSKPKPQASLSSNEDNVNDYGSTENSKKKKRPENDAPNFFKDTFYAIRPIYKVTTDIYDFNNYPSINKDESELSNNFYDNDDSRTNSNNRKQPNYAGYTTSKPNSNRDRPNSDEEPTRKINNRPTYNTYTTSRPTFNNQRPDNSKERPTNNQNNTPKPKNNQNNNQRPTINNSNPNIRRPVYDSFTTQNPFYNRPGVKPAVTQGPPITNKPFLQKPRTDRPTYGKNHNYGKDDGSILFPEEQDVSAELVTGPDEDLFTDAQRRRYLKLAEQMCDRYKALDMSQVAAIPLLPSPQPVRVNVSGCRPLTAPLIVGGKVVNIEQFPHNAALGWQKLEGGGYSWKCGGSLISDQLVLTAAHCAYQERDNTVIPGPPRVVQLGSSYLDDPGALVVQVSKAIRHPKYRLPRSYYDLAVLKLANKVTFSEVIKPACLGVPPAPGESIIATGWGRTEFGGETSLELRGVSIPIWDIGECGRVLGTSRRLPDGPSPDSQVCAGEVHGGKDTCQGDSGGPAQVQDACAWRVIGVTSVGRACGAPRTPALYATVQRAFLAAILADHA